MVCPDPALDFSTPDDFELLYWSPALKRRDERRVHGQFPDRFGEWIGADREGAVLCARLLLDAANAASACDKEAALRTRRLL